MGDLDSGSESGYKDRSQWLTALGVYLWITGLFIGIAQARGLSAKYATAPSMAIYSAILMFVEVTKRAILGWGSIKARRWARALVLISSWFNLGVGIISVPMMYWVMRHLPTTDPRVTPQAIAVMALVTSSMMMVFGVIIPGVFVRFYGSQDVIRTCEARNPEPSWTDACPLPVLGMALVLTQSAIYSLLVIVLISGMRYPFFVWSVGGAVGKVIVFIMALGGCGSAYLLYRMNRTGLLTAAMFMGFGFLNVGVFFAVKGWAGYMEMVGDSSFGQKEMLSTLSGMGPLIGTLIGIGSISMVSYFIFLNRKYFSHKTASGA